MELFEQEKKISKSEILDFEKKHNVKFPDTFIDFYLKNNGGIPIEQHFETFGIDYFNPFNKSKFGIEATYLKHRENEIIQQDKEIPFAHDGGGWSYIIDLNEANYGQIFLIPLDRKEYYFVAESFKYFIDNCSEEDNW